MPLDDAAMNMTAKQRMLTALDGGVPDRLPVTTHFLMPHFLNASMGGMSEDGVLRRLRLGPDHVHHAAPSRPDARRVLRSGSGHAGLPGKPADRQRPLARALRGDCRAEAPHHPLPLRHAQGHAEHGSGGRSLYGLGGRAAGEGETRHRPDRPSTSRPRSATWRP